MNDMNLIDLMTDRPVCEQCAKPFPARDVHDPSDAVCCSWDCVQNWCSRGPRSLSEFPALLPGADTGSANPRKPHSRCGGRGN